MSFQINPPDITDEVFAILEANSITEYSIGKETNDVVTVKVDPADSSLIESQLAELGFIKLDLDVNTIPVLQAFSKQVYLVPGNPKILSTPVTVPNDALPQNLEELGAFLSPNSKYTFRFRATKYSSDVALDLSFAVPGDADAATISWNDTTFNGLTLGDDDESPMAATGNDISSSEVSGTITVNSEAGFLIPQVRQDTADNQTSEVTEAYMEVIQSG